MSFLLFALAAAAPAVPTQIQVIAEDGKYVLRSNSDGKPLYVFDKDEPNKSNCVDKCLAAWPAVTAAAGAKPVGKWSAIKRPDGTAQWAYEGKPVYTFARDTEGAATGDGMGGVWHLLPATAAE